MTRRNKTGRFGTAKTNNNRKRRNIPCVHSYVSILERRDSSCWQAELCHCQSYFLSSAKKSNTLDRLRALIMSCWCVRKILSVFICYVKYLCSLQFDLLLFLVLGQESEPVLLKAGLTLTIKMLSASSSRWMFCLLLSVKKQGTTP